MPPSRPSDSRIDFLTPVSRVPGLGPSRTVALAECGIETIGDLLYHFPHRYLDRSRIFSIADALKHPGENVVVIATVDRTAIERGRRPRLRMLLRDDSGSITALFFAGIQYYSKTIRNGMRLLISGKVQWYGVPQFVHPSVEQLPAGKERPEIAFMPVYPLTGSLREAGLAQKGLCKAILWVLDHIEHFPQVLPLRVEEQKKFPPLATCLKKIHLPDNPALLDQYCDRLRYEELWRLAITARISRQNFALPGMSMDPAELAMRFQKILPFTLTDAQKQAVAVLLADAKSPDRMHRLLQGDVGCGKTVVAFYACCAALGSGRQVAWLTPTEILARQTAARLKLWCDALDISISCLTAATPSDQKKEILRGCSDGKLQVVVGTHSLLQPTVRLGKLGMVVVDEQHRFGAGQRLTMAQKNPAADMLLMSATPIPQSLARTIYGDLDMVTITAGRHGTLCRGKNQRPCGACVLCCSLHRIGLRGREYSRTRRRQADL